MEIPKYRFLWEYVDYWAEIKPDYPMIRYKKKVITAMEVKKRSDTLAKAFLETGVHKGDLIAPVIATTPEFIFTYIASSKIGAIIVPMDKEYKTKDFETLIPHSNPKVIVAMKRWEKNKIADNLLSLKNKFGDIHYITIGKHELGESLEDVLEKDYTNGDDLEKRKKLLSADDCLMVIWTGGTTGAPKAVELSNINVIDMAILEYKKIHDDLVKVGYNPEEGILRFLVNMPMSHVGGIIELLTTGIIHGLEMIVQASWSPWDSLKAMRKYNIPFMGGVPTMFKILLSIPDLDTYSPKEYLKLIVMSGEKVSAELLRNIEKRICKNIVIGYGSTEAGAEVTFTDIEDDFKKIADGYIGKALPGVDIKIINEEGKKLATGQQGEIVVKGSITSSSYYKMPDKNKEGFTEDGYCKTGDIGYMDSEGSLYISGRIKEIIRVGGYTVFPPEIEGLALEHPKVAIAAALGAPAEIHGEVVWLVVGPELGQKFTDEDKEELLESLKQNLAKFKIPKKIIVYPLDPNNLPITRLGKVDRKRLKKELIE
ncbi:MAG: AMP-binding protein [Candidatus Lokiarchaeota archaeon]|nr:AMP-binding protein [Candidatus Lokiarchaeota archaeon]MBD3199138.1 AMP-binding protein [Candidatus Lokiarchaeota archaeon]